MEDEAKAIVSVNAVFADFSPLPDSETQPVKLDDVVQKGDKILEHFSSEGAKMGYGAGGYLPAPKWQGTDIPFETPMGSIPWGRAILCEGTMNEGTLELVTLGDGNIQGTCYGVTIKDSSPQLNAAFSVNSEVSNISVTSPEKSLVVAIMANASVETVEGEEMVVEEGETVVAISEALDPTVFHAEAGIDFTIPRATGGYTFTVRGTLMKAPFVHFVPTYTSLKDKVSSFPTSQAILDAKING